MENNKSTLWTWNNFVTSKSWIDTSLVKMFCLLKHAPNERKTLKTASYDKKKSKDSGKWTTLRYHISELHLENENKKTSPVYFNKENKE